VQCSLCRERHWCYTHAWPRRQFIITPYISFWWWRSSHFGSQVAELHLFNYFLPIFRQRTKQSVNSFFRCEVEDGWKITPSRRTEAQVPLVASGHHTLWYREKVVRRTASAMPVHVFVFAAVAVTFVVDPRL